MSELPRLARPAPAGGDRDRHGHRLRHFHRPRRRHAADRRLGRRIAPGLDRGRGALAARRAHLRRARRDAARGRRPVRVHPRRVRSLPGLSLRLDALLRHRQRHHCHARGGVHRVPRPDRAVGTRDRPARRGGNDRDDCGDQRPGDPRQRATAELDHADQGGRHPADERPVPVEGPRLQPTSPP